jgi:hypothetical protein
MTALVKVMAAVLPQKLSLTSGASMLFFTAPTLLMLRASAI